MRFNALLFCAAIAAASAFGCGDPETEEAPATDSLDVDTTTVSVPMDTTSLSDSLNAPVRPDTTDPRDTASAGASISKSTRDTAVAPLTPGATAPASSGDASTRRDAGSVGSGVRRETSAGAEGRRVDTGGSVRRR